MKKFLIGSLVGAILVFGWQSVAHMFLSYHNDAYQQTGNDAAILNALSSANLAEGQYFVPGINMDATPEQQQQFSDSMKGKPWAQITYHPSFEEDMGMSILRSFVTAFICVSIFIAILGKQPGSFVTIFLKSIGVGFLMFSFIWYNQNIWIQTPWNVIKGEMIDDLASWGLCGLWLGWWLNKISKSPRSRYGPIS